jgi:hypothetical protein
MDCVIYEKGSAAGTLTMASEGLYWNLHCKMKPSKELYRLYAVSGLSSVYLGIPDSRGELRVRIAKKHLPEMQAVCGLAHKPVFSPIVDDYYKGMATTVPLHMSQLKGVATVAEVREKLQAYYAGQKMVTVSAAADTAKIYGNAKAGQDTLEIIVAGNDEQFTVTALFDNLGKGASGAAVQNMNIMLGFEADKGLNV